MCKVCETKPVYEFTNQRKLCSRCFVRWFEKKFLYIIRRFAMIRQGDVIGYESKGDFREAVLEYLLKMFSEKINIKLIKPSSREKINKTAVSDSADFIAYKITDFIINKKLNKKSTEELSPKNKSVIRPLYLFLDKEVLLYAKLKKLKFRKPKEKKNKTSKVIDELERKHPEIKNAIVKGCLEVYD